MFEHRHEPTKTRVNDLASVLARGASGSGFAHIAALILGLGAQLVLARTLGVDSFGYFIIAWTWVLILAIPCRLGFHNSLIRFTSSYRVHEQWNELRGLFHLSFGLVFALGIVSGAVLIAGASLIGERISEELYKTILFAAVALPGLALLGVTQAILKGFRWVTFGQFTQRGLPNLGLLLITGLWWLIYGIEDASVAMLIGVSAVWLSVATSVFWVWRASGEVLRSSVPAYLTRFWLRSSLPLLLLASMTAVMGQTDTLMLGAMVGSREGGIYATANRLAQLVSLGLMATTGIVAPLIAEYFSREDFDGLRRILALVAWGVLIFTVFAFLFVAIFGDRFLSFFGDEFRIGRPALIILALGQVVNATCGPVGITLTMTGHQRAAAITLTLAAILNVVLNLLFIPIFGLEGAAWASTLSIAMWNVSLAYLAFRKLGLNTTILQRPPAVFG